MGGLTGSAWYSFGSASPVIEEVSSLTSEHFYKLTLWDETNEEAKIGGNLGATSHNNNVADDDVFRLDFDLFSVAKKGAFGG